MIRRIFLLGASGAGLAACGGTTVDASVVQVATDVQNIALSLQDAVNELKTMTVPGLTTQDMTNIASDLGYIQSLASQISAAATTTAQQPLVAKIAGYINSVLSVLIPILAAIPAAQGVAAGLAAVQVVLPVIFSLVGLVFPSTASAPRAALAPAMTIAQARVILAGMAAKASGTQK